VAVVDAEDFHGTRRLREAVEEFSASAKRQTRWMIWLTVTIAILTLVLVVLALPDSLAQIMRLCS
jgi:hypothetical protein